MIDVLDDATASLAGLAGQTCALADDALEATVHRLAALRTTLDALWLEALTEADQRRLAARVGARDTATWLAGVAGERVGTARRDLELATTLAATPVVAQAMASGAVSKTKAALLAEAAALPDDVQRQLVHHALDATVGQVGNAVRRARLANGEHEPPVEPSCCLTRTTDRLRLEATVDLVDGEHLEVALDTMAEVLKLPTDLPYPIRRAKALVALAKHYLDHANDVPTSRVGRPHVLVLVDIDTLLARHGGHATLASGAVITGAQARQLAVDANITRIITRGRSEILDAGRTTRTATPAQTKAVIARDRHCRFRGCDAPPWACEVHHRQPWLPHGTTDLANLGLVCWHHHTLTHRHGPHLLAEDDDGRWRLLAPEPCQAAA